MEAVEGKLFLAVGTPKAIMHRTRTSAALRKEAVLPDT